MNARPIFTDAEAAAIRDRKPFKSVQIMGYRSKGGTYVIASTGLVTDSGKPRDLIAVLPGDLGQGQVLALTIGVNPSSVDKVRELVTA